VSKRGRRKFTWSDVKATQKGSHLTSYVNKPLEDLLVYLLGNLSVLSADHITMIVNALAFIVAYLIAAGRLSYALPLMLLVCILDGVDGKIARLLGKPTRIGKLEHSLDFLYEQAWYAAITWLVFKTTGSYLHLGLAWLITDAYVRHVYNLGWIAVGRPIKHWGTIGRAITTVDGRRNIYVWYTIASHAAGKLHTAVILSLAHAAATAIAYTALTLRKLKHTAPNAPSRQKPGGEGSSAASQSASSRLQSPAAPTSNTTPGP